METDEASALAEFIWREVSLNREAEGKRHELLLDFDLDTLSAPFFLEGSSLSGSQGEGEESALSWPGLRRGDEDDGWRRRRGGGGGGGTRVEWSCLTLTSRDGSARHETTGTGNRANGGIALGAEARTEWARDEITRSSTDVATWHAALHSICAAPLQAEPKISDPMKQGRYGDYWIFFSEKK